MPTVSMLASVADLAASQAAGAISQLMPSGVILPFGGATAPTGWLLCNGATINRTTYAALFAAIGTAHGSGDGSTTFHLPDLRGRFVRGTDGGQARDPDRASRTAANTGGNTGDAVGSVQGNATNKNSLSATAGSSSVSGSDTINKNQWNSDQVAHGHGQPTDPFYSTTGGISAYVRAGGGGVNLGQMTNASASWNSANASGTISGTAAAQTITMGAGDNETRPLNANVNYIIKV